MDTNGAPAPALDLEPAARQMAGLAAAVEDRRLTGPTPAPTTRYVSCSPISPG
ncbi:hypothetical protein NKH18_41985 [Streptomyces sp. M10(2022)]